MTTSIRSVRSGRAWIAATISGGSAREERVEVVDRFAVSSRSATGVPPQRTAGTRAGSATRTSVSFIRSVTVAIVLKPSSSSRCSSGDL